MKKLVSLSLILIIVMTLVTNVYAASPYKLTLKPSKRTLKVGDEFTVDVKLSSIQDEKGIIALGATLKYDESSLKLVKMEGKGEWSKPTYNEANGEFVTDRNGYAEEDETVFTITFKVEEESKQNLEIILTNISASNGNEDLKVDEINVRVTVESSADDDNIIPRDLDDPFIEDGNETENKNGNVAQTNQTMPDTGSSNVVVILIAVATVAAIVSFVRMKKIEERM